MYNLLHRCILLCVYICVHNVECVHMVYSVLITVSMPNSTLCTLSMYGILHIVICIVFKLL